MNLPNEKVVAVHGTMHKASCENCGAEMNFDNFCNQVETKIKDIYNLQSENGKKESEEICCDACGKATVKPKSVLFGSSLPTEFFECIEKDLPSADLLLIAGTSLVVSPANSLVYRVPNSTYRVVINNERAGKELQYLFTHPFIRDCFIQGSCEEVFLDLITELGWLEDLNRVIDNLSEDSVNLMIAKKNRSDEV